MRFGKYFLIASLFGAVSTWAIKAAPFLINSTQPDGSVVQIRKIGNERFNYTVTGEDSVLVVRDSSGYWNYADKQKKKTGMRVHAKSKRSAKERNFLKKRNSREILEKFREKRLKQLEEQRESEPQVLRSSSPMLANAWGGGTKNTNTPTRPSLNSVKKEGDVRGLVILVQFSDVTFKRDNAKEEYHDFLNKEGYSNYYMKGSARDFFILNSSGKYRPTFDVFGPVTLKGKRDAYGALVDPNNIAAGAVKAVSEAIDSLVAANVDFTPYDSDNDRIVDFVYMIYAGVGSADTDVQSAISGMISLSAFPNPTSDYLTLRIESEDIEGFDCVMYDISGKEILQKQITSSETSLNVQQLPSATYFVRVTKGKNEVKTFKIVKN